MNIRKLTLILFLIAIITVSLIGCSNPLMDSDRATSSITINTGLSLRESRGTATDVASFNLIVTAEDMSTIEESFSSQTISLDLDAGPGRTFNLQGLDSASNQLFSGSSTVNLIAGQTTTVVIEMDYAGYYVDFDMNGGLAIPKTYVEKGGFITISSSPIRTGYSFAGWYADAGLTVPWDFALSTVTEDLTVYAKWIPLLARWTFDGTLVDEAGGYNATGTPSYDASNPGKDLDQSFYFDGSQMLSVPAIDLGGQFSLSVWVNFSGGSTINTIMSNNSDTGNSDGFKFYINYWSTSNRDLWINTGDGAGQGDVGSGQNIMPIGGWHHIVFLADKTTGVGQIYLDSVLVETTGNILSSFATNTDLKIGGVDYSAGVFFFNGYMSDLRLYSGVLTPIEISAIYNE